MAQTDQTTELKLLTVQDLKQLLQELENRSKEIRDEMRKVKIEIYVRETGLCLGAKVRFKDIVGLVVGYDSQFSVLAVIKIYKKDGRLGERQTKIWWHHLSQVEILESNTLFEPGGNT